MYVQLNIGRSVDLFGHGRWEMPLERWNAMLAEATQALADFTQAMRGGSLFPAPTDGVELHTGVGFFSEKGETSAHLSIYFDGHTRVDSIVEEFIDDLETDLKGIAQEYDQHCIGLVIAGTYTNKGDRATLCYS